MSLIYIRKNNKCHLKCAILLCLTIIYGCRQDVISSSNSVYEKDHHVPELKWGFVNEFGQEVVEARYDDARDFSEGLAAVNFQAYWGYVDKQGQTIIDFVYKKASAFKSDQAIVQDADDNWFVINQSNEKLLSCHQSQILSLSNNVALVKGEIGLGLIDLDGDTLLDFKSSNVIFTKDPDNVFTEQSGTWKFVDLKTGSKLLNLEKVYPSKTDRFKFKRDGKYGFLNQLGDVVIEAQYNEAYDFHESKAVVSTNQKGFIINEEGDVKYEYSLDSFEYHSPGYLMKQSENGQRLYDHNLQIVIDEPHDLIYRPVDGIVGLMKDDMWGFYSIKGNCTTGLIYPLVWEAKNGFARFIQLRQGIGFIDQDCQEIIKAQFYEVRDFHEQYARFQKLY